MVRVRYLMMATMLALAAGWVVGGYTSDVASARALAAIGAADLARSPDRITPLNSDSSSEKPLALAPPRPVGMMNPFTRRQAFVADALPGGRFRRVYFWVSLDDSDPGIVDPMGGS